MSLVGTRPPTVDEWDSIIYTITEEQPWINSVGIAENPLF